MLENFINTVRRTTLSNGLTLLTRETRGTGVVAINTWVKAGYFHEPDEVAGMAHLFEHMFFKGSKNFPGAEEIAQHVSSLGGVTNAATIYDSTNYYFVMPVEGFVKGVEIQADAILHPLFHPEELKKEAEVVIEESNRKLDNPPAVATERMYETAFTDHRMRRWRIGSNEVLRNIRRDDLIVFFETLYRPSNIIVTIVGDVTHEEAILVVERTFGRLPAGSLKKERGPQEPLQDGFRFGESYSDIRQSFSVFGWHTPGEGSEEDETLELLSSVLGSGRSSRFYREVVGQGGANVVSAFNTVFEDIGIFTVRANYEDANLQEVEERILTQIERLKKFGPTDYELQLAKNRSESSLVFELEDVLGQAQLIAYFEARGAYEDIRKHIAKIRAVTPEMIRAAAEKYLTVDNLTLYHYRPAGSPFIDRDTALEMVRAAIEGAELKVPESIAIPALPAALAQSVSEPPVKRFVLSNGATLFVRERAGTPAVSAAIYFRGGRVHENSSIAGITQLMARTMRRGTRTRTGEQIDREIEFLGTALGIAVDEDFFGFSVDVLQPYFPAALSLLADVVLAPTFAPEGVEEEKYLQLAAIRRGLDSSSDRPFQLFFSTFYGNHPYALPDSGFLSSVEILGSHDLRDWYEQNVAADAALIVIVGDVVADDVYAVMEKTFAKLPKSVALRPAIPQVIPPQTQIEITETRNRKQTAVVIGYQTVPPPHPDWIPLRVLQDVTSGLAGTFFAELRGKRSLAYTVFAGDSSRQFAGAFVGYIASEASKEEAARKGLIDEMKRLGTDGIQPEDLARAKSYLSGATKIRLQTNSSLAAEIAQNYLYGLGLDFTERFLDRVHGVTLDELRAIAKKYLSHDNYTVATLRGKG